MYNRVVPSTFKLCSYIRLYKEPIPPQLLAQFLNILSCITYGGSLPKSYKNRVPPIFTRISIQQGAPQDVWKVSQPKTMRD